MLYQGRYLWFVRSPGLSKVEGHENFFEIYRDFLHHFYTRSARDCGSRVGWNFFEIYIHFVQRFCTRPIRDCGSRVTKPNRRSFFEIYMNILQPHVYHTAGDRDPDGTNTTSRSCSRMLREPKSRVAQPPTGVALLLL